MIRLRYDEESRPGYASTYSAGCDLKARTGGVIEPGQVALVPTGVFIEGFDSSAFPAGTYPELQIRARSGLARKHGITLANGVGTVDADYPDEIGVLLLNTSATTFSFSKGERIAQMVLSLVARIPGLPVGGDRQGGFGSTGK